ncbi:MAG: sensor histidine kinase, partial [Spirochaetes bacterium]|nr:sensor histidine kinase [Spirochaetota bacterium]
EDGDFSGPIQVSGQKEIVLLAHSFNSMVQKVQELMDNLVEEQHEKRKTELRALQNQINPHFLYNTLDSIVWLAEHERNRDVINTVVSLARFFRIAISKGEAFITVAEELAHVQNYLNIQTIRYVNKFNCSFDMPDELKNYKVMKLILQPLVENAIYHGVGDEGGDIDVVVRKEGDSLIFRVSNTGYGISDSKIQEMYQMMRGDSERSSVGIRNVYQRLNLYYGERAQMLISSVPDESTTVTLIIPTVPVREENN